MFSSLLILLGISCFTKDVDNCCDALVEIFEDEFEDEFEEEDW